MSHRPKGLIRMQIGVLTNQHSHLKAECARHSHSLLAAVEEGKAREAEHKAEKEAWARQREDLDVRCALLSRQLMDLEGEHSALKSHLDTLLAASDAGISPSPPTRLPNPVALVEGISNGGF